MLALSLGDKIEMDVQRRYEGGGKEGGGREREREGGRERGR